jgi:uncharacterized protein (DUF2141 family)
MTTRLFPARTRFAALLAAPLIAFAAPAFADDAASPTGRVSLEISGIVSAGGEIAVALYAQEGAWLGSNPVAAQRVPAEGGVMTIVFEGLAPGRYAASVYQDINANGALDTGFMGIPSEPYGFTSGAVARFGPPAFDAASFEIVAGQEAAQAVTLRGGR